MYLIQFCVYQKGDSTAYHAAEHNNAILTLSGHAEFQESGHEKFDCLPGTFFVIPPRVSYKWRIVEELTLFQCLHKPFSFLKHRAFANLFGVSNRHLSSFQLEKRDFEEFKQRIERDAECQEDARGLMLSADMLRIMASAVALFTAGDTSQHPALVRAISHLEANVHRSISLTELSRHAGMGSSRLSQLFRERVGKSPMQYLAMLKAEHATKLLLVDDLRAGEAADRLGFSSESYFRRFYKRQTGVSPGQARIRNKGHGFVI